MPGHFHGAAKLAVIQLFLAATGPLAAQHFHLKAPGNNFLTDTSEASPQTAESCRVSFQHSRWLTSLIDAFHTTVKRRLGSQRRLSVPSGDIPLQGTHRLIQRRHGELAKGVRSEMPPRYLVLEEVDV